MFTGIQLTATAFLLGLLHFAAHSTQAEENATEIFIKETRFENFTEETEEKNLTEKPITFIPTTRKLPLSPAEKAKQWLIQKKDKHSGWGSDTHRAIIALALSDLHHNIFEYDWKTRLSLKQLDLQLAVALAKQQEEHFSQGQLALYINALLAVCRNPRDFYGINLVAKLYRPKNISADSASFNSKYEFALVSLTLCNAGVHFRKSHLLALIDLLPEDASKSDGEKDHEIMAILALQCATYRSGRLSYLKRYLDRALEKLRRRQDSETGGFGNIYSSALIIQAMIEAGDQVEWNKEAALSYLSDNQEHDGSFGGDLLATYLALPPLVGRSLISVSNSLSRTGSLYCQQKGQILPEIEERNGDEVEINRTISVTISVQTPKTNLSKVVFVPEKSTLYDVVKNVEGSGYRFQIKTYTWGPYITGINDLEQNVIDKLYWVVYKYDRTDHTIAPIQSGIDDVYIEESDHYIFIYKK